MRPRGGGQIAMADQVIIGPGQFSPVLGHKKIPERSQDQGQIVHYSIGDMPTYPVKLQSIL